MTSRPPKTSTDVATARSTSASTETSVVTKRAQRAKLVGELLAAALVHVGQDHRRALGGEQARRPLADAARRARDHRALAV